ncbi:MAG: caspase family protein [Bacteroidota bacterium]
MAKNKRGGLDLNPKSNREYTSGTSWFLGIGINEYLEMRNLNNAVKDVTDISELLMEKYGLKEEHTFVLTNQDADEKNILSRLMHLADNAGENDKVIIYYSGHGLVDKYGFGYWLPYNAEKDNPHNNIANEIIHKWIKAIKAKHILLIADSCYSGSLLQEGVTRATDRAVNELEAIQSRWALCSGRGDEEVYDGKPGGNSPFTESILSVLKNNIANAINISKLFDQVMAQTRDKFEQLPQGRPLANVGHKGGQYIFRPKTEDDKDLWIKALEEGNLEAFKYYLNVFPEGKYADKASAKVYDIEDEQAWQDAITEDVPGAYYVYIRNFKEGKYIDQAKEAINRLQPQAGTNPIVNPDSEKLKSELASLKESLKTKEENNAWETALRQQNIKAYEAYLNQFPNGGQSKTAKKQVKKWKAHEKKEKAFMLKCFEYATTFKGGLFSRKQKKTYIKALNKDQDELASVWLNTEKGSDTIQVFMYDFNLNAEKRGLLKQKKWIELEGEWMFEYALAGNNLKTHANSLYDFLIYTMGVPSGCIIEGNKHDFYDIEREG